MTAGQIYAWVAIAFGGYMVFMTLANIVYLRWVSRPLPRTDESVPPVSVLIPARNEAERIGPAIRGLKEQGYPDFEVIVLDDNSEDGTAEVVRELAGGDKRIRCIPGEKLPQGWKGKPYAMQQLIAAARGEILIFIDADMKPGPDLVSWTVEHLDGHGVDFLSGYVRHTAPERSEYFLFPVMYLATSFLLPLWLFRHSRTYMFSHAIGQYFCVRSSVMEVEGGFEPVRDKINEDIQMARYLKGRGYSQVFLDAKAHIEGNMYDSMEHARMGVMRVIYEYFDKTIHPFIIMGAFMVVFLLLPPVLTPIAFLAGWSFARPLAISIGVVLFSWIATMVDRRQPWFTAFLYPVHFGWAMILSVRSIILARKGLGYSWKGRIVH